jgi:hypothetical protein
MTSGNLLFTSEDKIEQSFTNMTKQMQCLVMKVMKMILVQRSRGPSNLVIRLARYVYIK